LINLGHSGGGWGQETFFHRTRRFSNELRNIPEIAEPVPEQWTKPTRHVNTLSERGMKCLELFRRMEDTQEGTGDFVVGAAQLVIGSSNL
jgi:hypothetical protein